MYHHINLLSVAMLFIPLSSTEIMSFKCANASKFGSWDACHFYHIFFDKTVVILGKNMLEAWNLMTTLSGVLSLDR